MQSCMETQYRKAKLVYWETQYKTKGGMRADTCSVIQLNQQVFSFQAPRRLTESEIERCCLLNRSHASRVTTRCQSVSINISPCPHRLPHCLPWVSQDMQAPTINILGIPRKAHSTLHLGSPDVELERMCYPHRCVYQLCADDLTAPALYFFDLILGIFEM